MSGKSAEQEARDLLERLDIEDAQSFSSGELVELANLIAEVARLRRNVRYLELLITEDVGHLSGAERAELNELSNVFAAVGGVGEQP